VNDLSLSDDDNLPVNIYQEQVLVSLEWSRRKGPESPHANVILTGIRLCGPLDVGALECSINEIVQRHSALRATFFPNPNISTQRRDEKLQYFARTGFPAMGLYRQSIRCINGICLRAVDLAFLEPIERDTEMKRVLKEETTTHFNYATPPLMRAVVLKNSPLDHLLILVVDHLVADSWAMRIVRRDLERLYPHFAHGTDYPFPSALSPYSRAILTQCRGIDAPSSDSLLYWHQQWSRFGAARIATRHFPYALPVSRVPLVHGGWEHCPWEQTAAEEIQAFARKGGITIYILFLAAYVTVLHYHTGKNKLSIWGNFANRRHPDLQDVVGCFVNTHLLGVELELDPTFRDVMQQVKSVVLGAMAHDEMPVDVLWLQTHCYPRYRDALPMFDFRLFDRHERHNSNSPIGVSAEHVPLPHTGAPQMSSLAMYVTVNNGLVSVDAHYWVDRFPQSAIKQLIEDFRSVVLAFVADTDARISSLSRLRLNPSVSRNPDNDGMAEFVACGSDLIPMPNGVSLNGR
jgi:hypothetical protein